MQDEIFEKLKGAWIAVSPSYTEVSPNFVLEACASATPVIVTEEVGLSLDIRNKLFTFDPFDKQSLIMAMQTLLNEEEWARYRKVLTELDLSRNYAAIAREHDKLFQ